MENYYSFKEFEKVKLKAYDDGVFGDREVEAGEIIAAFDRISIAGLSENNSFISAHGGFGDRDLVTWEIAKEADLVFTQGVFSPTQFAIANNTAMQDVHTDKYILITQEDEREADEDGKVYLSYEPDEQLFIYELPNKTRYTGEWTLDGRSMTGLEPYKEYLITYEYRYTNGGKVFWLGQHIYNGFFSLEGQTTFKDDKTGRMLTGILKLPKIKMNGGLSIRLGTQASPNVVNFTAKAYPAGSGYFSEYGEFYILNDDINSDIL